MIIVMFSVWSKGPYTRSQIFLYAFLRANISDRKDLHIWRSSKKQTIVLIVIHFS